MTWRACASASGAVHLRGSWACIDAVCVCLLPCCTLARSRACIDAVYLCLLPCCSLAQVKSLLDTFLKDITVATEDFSSIAPFSHENITTLKAFAIIEESKNVGG